MNFTNEWIIIISGAPELNYLNSYRRLSTWFIVIYPIVNFIRILMKIFVKVCSCRRMGIVWRENLGGKNAEEEEDKEKAGRGWRNWTTLVYRMSGLMGPPPSAGPSRGKRRASSDSSASISDYASAEEDDLSGCGEGKKARIAPSSASTASAGSHHFDAYVHEGHYFNFPGYQTFLWN